MTYKGFIPLESALNFNHISLEYQNQSDNSQQRTQFININQQNQGFNANKGKGVTVGGNYF